MTSTPDTDKRGFAVRCDLDGTITEILHDDLSILGMYPNRHFNDIVDVGSRGKCTAFFRQLLGQQAAFGCEVSMRHESESAAVHLAGVQIDDGMIVIGARSIDDVAAFCDNFMAMHNEQTNALRSLMKERADKETAGDAFDEEAYDEMMRLNNELTNLQRQMAKEQVELERLNREAERRSRELDDACRATSALLETLDIDELSNRIVESAASVIHPAQSVCLIVFVDEKASPYVRCINNRTDQELGEEARSMTLQDRLMLERSARDAAAESIEEDRPICRSTPEQPSQLAVRLYMHGQTCGAIGLSCGRPEAFTDDHVKLLQTFAATASAAVRNACLHAQVKETATTDSLTGVKNRRGFFEEAEPKFQRALHGREPMAMLMFDIDHFKKCNDEYGHAVGDEVLVEVAQRCAAVLRPDDVFGRCGGEEFAVLLTRCEAEDAVVAAERLRTIVGDSPFETEAGPLPIHLSIGLAVMDYTERELDDLLERADEAMYDAKESGRNTVRCWTQHDHSRAA